MGRSKRRKRSDNVHAVARQGPGKGSGKPEKATAIPQSGNSALRASKEAQAAARQAQQAAQEAKRAADAAAGQKTDIRTVLILSIAVPVFVTLLGNIASPLVLNAIPESWLDFIRRWRSDPISVVTVVDRDARVQGLTWALPTKLGSLNSDDQLQLNSSIAQEDEFTRWIRKRGGMDVDYSFIRLALRGEWNSEIKITDIRARVKDRDLAVRGALFLAPPEGDKENPQIAIDLDEGDMAPARMIDKRKDMTDPQYIGGKYFQTNTVYLKKKESLIISIVAMTKLSYVAWNLEIDVMVDGRETRTIPVGPQEEGYNGLFKITSRADNRSGQKDSFGVYEELYVLEGRPKHFTGVDPRGYSQEVAAPRV